MAEHTPGPWSVEPVYGTDIGGEPFRSGHWIAGPEGEMVASADGLCILRTEDALLIAAAPDLLKALHKAAGALYEVHGQDIGCPDCPDAADDGECPAMLEVQAAIAKAEGR